MQYRYDAMLEGTEAEKNAALSPALAVPDLDKEVLLAQGKRIGMSPTESQRIEPTESAPTEKPPAPASKPSLTRRPTQDEVMGYHDDDDDDFMADDDMPYM